MNTAWNRWCRNLPSGTALSLYDNCITPFIITDITGRRNVRIQNPYTCTTSSGYGYYGGPGVHFDVVSAAEPELVRILSARLCPHYVRTTHVVFPHRFRSISAIFPHYPRSISALLLLRSLSAPFPRHLRSIFALFPRYFRSLSALFSRYLRTVP